MHSIPGRRLIISLFLIFLLLPIYWLVNMSFKTNNEIVTTMTLWPHQPTVANYKRIFTDESWYSGYINSLTYVLINTVISIAVALPAAYGFSRYRFLGDKHLFFWLLSNRMAPAAVYALPFFNLYSAINLFDTPWAVALAHCIFNVPLAVWILEGFVSGVPREIDETAFLDGYSFPRFFVKILVPLIASGIGVAAFFCFMFSWVELLLARTLTSVNAKPISAIMTRTVSAAGMDWGLLAAAGVTFIMGVPGADDVMLNYQSTSFHDALYVRDLFGLKRAPEFDDCARIAAAHGRTVKDIQALAVRCYGAGEREHGREL